MMCNNICLNFRFIQMIPDYDVKGKTKSTFLPRFKFGNDRQVTSELLNLHHFLNDKLLETFRNWTIYNNTTPDYIVMGLILIYYLNQ